MDKNTRRILITGTILGALAVIIGAFGAHGLEGIIAEHNLPQKRANIFDTGVEYHFYHTLAILACGVLLHLFQVKWFKWAFLSFLIGIVFFSGSLYGLALREFSFIPTVILGPITPIGGMFFIFGWIFMTIGIIKTKIK